MGMGQHWKVDVIPRVKMFCWIMMHERLLTNEDMVRRGISNDNSCLICNNGEENLLHLLTDCRRAKGIWLSLGALEKDTNFFIHDWKHWVSSNFKRQTLLSFYSGQKTVAWCVVFAVGYWLIWK